MFKTIYSKMLVTYLSVTLTLLVLVGVTCAAMFAIRYITKSEEELFREGDEIQKVLVSKYIDADKRMVATEELSTIARKYDGVIQVSFVDKSIGRINILGGSEKNNDKWSMVMESFPVAEGVEITSEGIIVDDVFKGLISLPTMTLMQSITSEDEEIALLCFTVDLSETNNAVKDVVMDVVIFAAIGIILAIIAVLYITDRMSKPIMNMTRVVREFSKGNYDVRVNEEDEEEDEVGELASSFNRMADEIGVLEEARRSFVANVSHELRSPLTSMSGFLVAMQDGTIPPEDFQKYLSIVIDENKRMNDMVNELLDMARIESGEHVLKLECFDITEEIRHTVITFEARINEKALEVIMEIGENPIMVEADKSQIAHVIRNLIDNAIKFTPEGGILNLSVLEQRKIVWVCVKDSGKGVSEEDLPYVFDRFFKAEKAHTPGKTAGTGLGLAIAKRIIDAHEQTICIKNEGGACFMFSLKRCPTNKMKSISFRTLPRT